MYKMNNKMDDKMDGSNRWKWTALKMDDLNFSRSISESTNALVQISQDCTALLTLNVKVLTVHVDAPPVTSGHFINSSVPWWTTNWADTCPKFEVQMQLRNIIYVSVSTYSLISKHQ